MNDRHPASIAADAIAGSDEIMARVERQTAGSPRAVGMSGC